MEQHITIKSIAVLMHKIRTQYQFISDIKTITLTPYPMLTFKDETEKTHLIICGESQDKVYNELCDIWDRCAWALDDFMSFFRLQEDDERYWKQKYVELNDEIIKTYVDVSRN